MFCGNLFKSTNLQNHKESHMIKLIPRVERALVLTLNNEFEEQTRISKIPDFFLVHPVFPRLSVGHSVPVMGLVLFK